MFPLLELISIPHVYFQVYVILSYSWIPFCQTFTSVKVWWQCAQSLLLLQALSFRHVCTVSISVYLTINVFLPIIFYWEILKYVGCDIHMIADQGCWVKSHSLLLFSFLSFSYSLMQICIYPLTRSVSVKCLMQTLSLHPHYWIDVVSVFDYDHKKRPLCWVSKLSLTTDCFLLPLTPGIHPYPMSIWNDSNVKKPPMQRDHISHICNTFQLHLSSLTEHRNLSKYQLRQLSHFLFDTVSLNSMVTLA